MIFVIIYHYILDSCIKYKIQRLIKHLKNWCSPSLTTRSSQGTKANYAVHYITVKNLSIKDGHFTGNWYLLPVVLGKLWQERVGMPKILRFWRGHISVFFSASLAFHSIAPSEAVPKVLTHKMLLPLASCCRQRSIVILWYMNDRQQTPAGS